MSETYCLDSFKNADRLLVFSNDYNALLACAKAIVLEKDKEIKSLKNGMATLQKKLEGVINVRISI